MKREAYRYEVRWKLKSALRGLFLVTIGMKSSPHHVTAEYLETGISLWLLPWHSIAIISSEFAKLSDFGARDQQFFTLRQVWAAAFVQPPFQKSGSGAETHALLWTENTEMHTRKSTVLIQYLWQYQRELCTTIKEIDEAIQGQHKGKESDALSFKLSNE